MSAWQQQHQENIEILDKLIESKQREIDQLYWQEFNLRAALTWDRAKEAHDV